MIHVSISIIIYLLFLYIFWRKGKSIDGISDYLTPGLFILKTLVGCFFLYIYTYFYGGGFLTHDAGEFLRESKLLNDLFYSHPKAFFTFLFGLEPSESYVLEYLEQTSHWSSSGKPLFNDSQNVIRVNALIYFLSGGLTLTHITISCASSLWAILESFAWVKKNNLFSNKYLILFLFALPSLLFWSSSFLKEPFMILGFALILRALFDDDLRVKSRLVKLIFGISLSLLFKPYVLLILALALSFYLLSTLLKKRKLYVSIVTFISILTLSLCFSFVREPIVQKITRQQVDFINVGSGGVHIARNDSILYFTDRDITKLRIDKKQVYIDSAIEGFYVTDNQSYSSIPYEASADSKPWMLLYHSKGSASHFNLTRINYSFLKMLKSAPEALNNAFFRPLIFDSGNWLMALAKIENVLMIFISLFVILKSRLKVDKKTLNIQLSLLIFIFFLMLLIGYTTPVTGAIVRYKIPAQLAFGIICILAFKLKTTK